jgi:pyrroline-5-carboxylate reductase
LKEIEGALTADKLVVSIAVDVTIDDISSLCDARVARVIPTVTSECSKGVSLVAFGDRSTEADRRLVLSAFSSISLPVETEENNLELLADLTSCAPAFISSLMHEFALSAVRREGISPELAELLVMETLAGTAELLKKVNCFEEVVRRVAMKGGITEEGVKVIRRAAPTMYDDLLEVTLAKHSLVKRRSETRRLDGH